MAVYLNDNWKGKEEGGVLRCFPCTDTTTHDVTVGTHEVPAGSRSSSTASIQAGGGGVVPCGGIDVDVFRQRPWTMDTLSTCPLSSMSTGTMKTTDDGGGWTILDITPTAETLVLLIPSRCPTWWMKVMGSRQRIAATFV